ncbi:FAD-binding protein [Stutzerimonas xanthomarina]|uniref:FAD-binding protein n=1 Tax=Stutzerimonas xanthomarina TaxID=271420 RepID=UPI003AA8E328
MLATEGCRGEGGYLINKHGERFMERYVLMRKTWLVVTPLRADGQGNPAGNGCGPDGDHVMLKLDCLGEEVLHSRLPGICEPSKTFAHVDPVTAWYRSCRLSLQRCVCH